MKNLGEQIYFYRTKCGFSQLDIAEKLEVSRQSVSKWENNSAIPELAKLVKLCELFGITLDELVNGESTPPDAISAPIIDSDADRDKIIITIKKPSFHPVKNTVVAHLSPKRIAGLCILGIGILFLLIMNLFAWHGDAYSSFLWGILFLTCSAICFCEHRHCALLSIWCVWGFFYSFYQIRSNTPAFAISVTVILALATILIRLKTSPISLMPAIAGALSAAALFFPLVIGAAQLSHLLSPVISKISDHTLAFSLTCFIFDLRWLVEIPVIALFVFFLASIFSHIIHRQNRKKQDQTSL